MKSLAINFVLFSIIIFGALYLLDFLYTQKVTTGKPISKLAWIFDKKKGAYDFAVIGNSRVYTVIDTRAIQQHSHLKGINLGTLGATPVEFWVIISRFLKSNQVKTVFLQLDSRIFRPTRSSENDKLPFFETASYMPYIKDQDVYDAVSNYSSPIKYLTWRYIPFVRYAEFNNFYSFSMFFHDPMRHWDETGYSPSEIKRKETIAVDTFGLRPINAAADSLAIENLFWAQKIVALCQSKNIRVVVFMSPIHRTSFNYPSTINAIDRVKVFSQRNGVPFWNWTRLFNNAPDSVFLDAFHLDRFGATDFATTFSDSLTAIKLE